MTHDADPYKKKNTVECLINKLKAWRGIATRYDKTPDGYLAGLHLRASMIAGRGGVPVRVFGPAVVSVQDGRRGRDLAWTRQLARA